MNDIFISYASADRERARAVAQALEARGWSVWWDREIPLGRSYDEVIETALAHARCMLVLWSATAVASEWVRSEASEGKRRAMLVPVFLEAIDAPLAFRLLNGARLDDWQPGQPSAEFERLCARVAELLDTPSNGRMAAAHELNSISAAPRGATSSVRAKATARAAGAVAALLVIAGGAYQYLAQPPARQHSVREPTPAAVTTAPLARPDAAPPASPPATLPATQPVAQATRALRPPERGLPRASAQAESKPDPEPASSHPVVAPQVAARTETPTPAASAPAAAPRSLLVAVLGRPVNRSFWSGETRASLAPKLDQAIERAARGVLRMPVRALALGPDAFDAQWNDSSDARSRERCATTPGAAGLLAVRLETPVAASSIESAYWPELGLRLYLCEAQRAYRQQKILSPLNADAWPFSTEFNAELERFLRNYRDDLKQ